MIQVSRLNGSKLIVNCELIKFIEQTPDTIITLTTGEKLMVREAAEKVIEATMHYRQRLYQEPPPKGPPVPVRADSE